MSQSHPTFIIQPTDPTANSEDSDSIYLPEITTFTLCDHPVEIFNFTPHDLFITLDQSFEFFIPTVPDEGDHRLFHYQIHRERVEKVVRANGMSVGFNHTVTTPEIHFKHPRFSSVSNSPHLRSLFRPISTIHQAFKRVSAQPSPPIPILLAKGEFLDAIAESLADYNPGVAIAYLGSPVKTAEDRAAWAELEAKLFPHGDFGRASFDDTQKYLRWVRHGYHEHNASLCFIGELPEALSAIDYNRTIGFTMAPESESSPS